MRGAQLIAVFIYPASEAPHYRVGYNAALGFALMCLICTGIFKWLDMRWSRRPAVQSDEPLYVEEDSDDKY